MRCAALALAVGLAALGAGPAGAEGSSRAPITVSKIVSSIPDGTEWAQPGDGCPGQERLKWNVGKGVIDMARLEAPVRAELRQEKVTVAADPADPFGARITSDLMLGGTITEFSAKLCGGDDVVGQLHIQVVWQVYSTSQKKVVTAVRTNATGTRDKPIAFVRLLNGVMAESAKQLLLNGDFERVLVTSGGGPVAAGGPGGPPPLPIPPVAPGGQAGAPSPPGPAQYGPGIAHGDLLPHAQERLVMGGLGGRGMKIDDSVQSVVAVLRPGSIGSAFLVSRDGYLLTNAHVVGQNPFVQVRWADGYETTGQVVRRDDRRDVALIKTDPHGRRPLPLKLEAPPVGQAVLAIGAPIALQGTVTRGIVSAERTLDGFGFIQSDAAVNPGNSGGPLLNERGEVVGIADLSNRANPGINFFVPINDALAFLGIEAR